MSKPHQRYYLNDACVLVDQLILVQSMFTMETFSFMLRTHIHAARVTSTFAYSIHTYVWCVCIVAVMVCVLKFKNWTFCNDKYVLYPYAVLCVSQNHNQLKKIVDMMIELWWKIHTFSQFLRLTDITILMMQYNCLEIIAECFRSVEIRWYELTVVDIIWIFVFHYDLTVTDLSSQRQCCLRALSLVFTTQFLDFMILIIGYILLKCSFACLGIWSIFVDSFSSKFNFMQIDFYFCFLLNSHFSMKLFLYICDQLQRLYQPSQTHCGYITNWRFGCASQSSNPLHAKHPEHMNRSRIHVNRYTQLLVIYTHTNKSIVRNPRFFHSNQFSVHIQRYTYAATVVFE